MIFMLVWQSARNYNEVVVCFQATKEVPVYQASAYRSFKPCLKQKMVIHNYENDLVD